MKLLLFAAAAALTAVVQTPNPSIRSIVVTVRADGGDERIVASLDGRFEAPNWSRRGDYLLVNSRGKLLKLPLGGGTPSPVETGAVTGINNDHGISPDSQW